jgi:hypothetical protein
MMMRVRAAIRTIDFDPDPRTLAGDPSGFRFLARLMIGPLNSIGEESFDVTVCSPEWLAGVCREQGPVDGLHHVVVDFDGFDERRLREFFERRVHQVEADDWHAVGLQLARLGWWEFEGYVERA